MLNFVKGPFFFSQMLGLQGFGEDMDTYVKNMGILTECGGFKDRIEATLDINENVNEIMKLNEKIYKKFLSDFKNIYPNGQEGDTILINVPSSHASSFLPLLIEEIHNSNSEISKYKVEYVVMDSPSIAGFGEDKEAMKKSYEELMEKMQKAHKYIEISDYQGVKSDFVEDEGSKKEFKTILKDFNNFKKNLKTVKPNLMLYFPSEQQASLAGMSLLEFSQKMYLAGNLDWERISEANEELAELFRDYDTVNIKGDNVDIEFDITGMGAFNSVIETNYPGSEVFTSPNREGVNGYIIYENQVRLKPIGETITGLKFRFENGRLEEVDIVDPKYTTEEREVLLEKIEKMLGDNEDNRYACELAFGTNFYVEPGFLHSLVGEKALGMHFALGKSYKNPADMKGKNQRIDNGNHNADFHIDIIRNMKDGSVVTFSKRSGEQIEVMNNGVYNQEFLPKLYEYQKEIE